MYKLNNAQQIQQITRNDCHDVKSILRLPSDYDETTWVWHHLRLTKISISTEFDLLTF
jgi:hypothetical protein